MKLALEDIVTGQGFADIDASPLQRAICRVADGRPLDGILTEDEQRRYFGCVLVSLVAVRLMVLVCGVRGGKSFLASCAAIWAALTADLSGLKKWEIPRVPIVAPHTDAAAATFVVLRGIVENSAVLRRFLDGDPSADTLVLRRPDGRCVEITVVAAHRGGLSMRNRWLAGFIADELAQFGMETTGAVVNAEEIIRAAETRLLPGCIGWLISSPYGPQGALHDLWKRHFGKPGSRFVVHADTRALNPTFPQETIDAIRAENPDVAAREYDAQWLDPDTALYPAVHVDAAIRPGPAELRPREPGVIYLAAIDPATRANSWTFIILGIYPLPPAGWAGRRLRVALARQWTGSKTRPLNPGVVLDEIAKDCRRYGVDGVHSDEHSADALRELANDRGLGFNDRATGRHRTDMYESVGTHLATGELELAPVPQLRTDLLGVRKRVSGSTITIVLPKTADGRHCDYAACLAGVVWAARHGGGTMPEVESSGASRFASTEQGGFGLDRVDWHSDGYTVRRGRVPNGGGF